MTPTHKTCPKCGVAKPIAAFHVNRARPDGLIRLCILCAKAAIKPEAKARALEYQRRYNRDHADEYRASQKARYWANRDRLLASRVSGGAATPGSEG